MKIHGRILEQHDYGNIIYYDNILIRSKSQKLNEWSTFESWAEYIEANPNFCGCKKWGYPVAFARPI